MRRSKFSLSHTKLLSCDMGELIPVAAFEALPGDSIQMASNLLVRAAPLLAPVMHPVEVRIHHWFVPYRLLWVDFEKFITGGPDGMDASVYPTMAFATTPVGSLADYMGLPLGTWSPPDYLPVSALPFRAYAMIYNENYRDQDLESLAAMSTASGVDSTTTGTLRNIAWEKDYFTSARPWEQKGPAVTLPLQGFADVESNQNPIQLRGVTENVDRQLTAATGTTALSIPGMVGATQQVKFGATTGLFADLSTASSVTVNMLREALAIQRFQEVRSRFGSRYTEYLRYLGVHSSDARLQRPEYLGGGKQTISFSEVLQTAEGTNPVGELRGHGITGVRSNRFRRYFEEHGIVMSLMSVRPKTIYMQGLSRMWNRRTKDDFWQRELEAIGQQGILNKEVYAAHTSPLGVFGYQDRYDEYRRAESTVSGEFRTSALNHWHMAREFSSDPALNATFVRSVPTERTFAVPSEDVIYVYARHSIQARRLVAQTGKSFIF